MHFYGYFRSSAAYRCRIAFNIKSVSPEFTSVHLRKNGGEQNTVEYRQLNPQGLVPTMSVEGENLTQSLAIIEWLEERYPDPPLLIGNAETRAQIRAFAQIIACDVHPLQNLRVLQYLKNQMGQSQEATDDWCRNWIHIGLSACDSILEQQAEKGAYCFGSTPTLADICLAPQIFSADRFGVSLECMTHIKRMRRTYESDAAFVNAHPQKQPDAE